ncbi:MAG: aminotransferase class I/II-fold pyridoxal phosphate-dependent enzyme [Rhodospirillaceae bacterium]|nr:aminotransferase class I/II-fold pyridoxal phosphate-dependent enzyme [Rhodospirillaceae bacterium]
MNRLIDLRSDTVSHPSPEMRKAMYEAELGDDYYRDDPTVHALEEKAAEALGTEAALLVLSGTMGNLAAVLTHTDRGDSVILDAACHIANNEAGHIATLGSVYPRTVQTGGGFMTPAQVEAAVFPHSVLHPNAKLLCLENTHNAAGGICLSPEKTQSLADAANARGLKVHIDGARIFNAAVALGVPAADLVRPVDSITFCLTKGLACPVGSVLCGSRDFIETARHWRQAAGGGMRQAGIFAAAGVVALDSMVERLAEDHATAKRLAGHLAEAGLAIDPDAVQTNMVFVELPEGGPDPVRFVADLAGAGVRINPAKGRRLRFVTHYGIEAEDIDLAGRQIAEICKQAA